MIIAIVGTSNLTIDESEEVARWVESKLRDEDIQVVTGDADGVDKVARLYTPRHRLIVKKSEHKEWGTDGSGGYKDRNREIAQTAEYVYCFTTRTKTKDCYHCNKTHQRTGGCWTLKEALKLGKKGEVIVV